MRPYGSTRAAQFSTPELEQRSLDIQAERERRRNENLELKKKIAAARTGVITIGECDPALLGNSKAAKAARRQYNIDKLMRVIASDVPLDIMLKAMDLLANMEGAKAKPGDPGQSGRSIKLLWITDGQTPSAEG